MRRLVFVLLLLLAACAGPEETDGVLDEDAANALAQGADRLAVALADDDACGALAEADALVTRTREGVEAGLVPNNVATEVEAVTAETTDDLACEPDEESTDGDADGSAPATTPDPEPEPQPPESDGGGDDPGNGEGRGQDRGGGPDREPPGQQDNPGQGNGTSGRGGGNPGQGGGQAFGDGWLVA